MALHLGLEAREEVARLEQARAHDEWFWRHFNSLRFDSWSEKRLLVRASLLGGEWVGVRLKRLGCSLDVVDGVSGGAAGLHRGFVIKSRTVSLVWCPQVAVRTDCGVLCVDNLLLLASQSKRVTVAVEVNGKPFHQDVAKQCWRDRQLGIPVLHLDAGELGKPGLIPRILAWAHKQLEAA